MYDCILSYYLDPISSGVAKFNVMLGREINVPIIHVLSEEVRKFRNPLISLKFNDMPTAVISKIEFIFSNDSDYYGKYSVLLHGSSGLPLEKLIMLKANRVYCANSQIYAEIEDYNPNTFIVNIPPMISINDKPQENVMQIFTFGMAHKIKKEKYRKLKTLLDMSGVKYCVRLSTAMHESQGVGIIDHTSEHELEDLFEDNLIYYGCLSDALLVKELRNSDLFAAFFDLGLRGNNTSAFAAMKLGIPVITNLDNHTPLQFEHMENVIDINQLDSFDISQSKLDQIAQNGMSVIENYFTWQNIVNSLTK